MINEFKLQFFLVQACGVHLEHTHFLKLKGHTAAIAQGSVQFIEMGFDVGNRTYVIVRGGFYQHSHTMGGVSFIQDLFEVIRFLSLGALDSGFYPVLGHVYGLSVLHAAPECGVGIGIRTAGLNGDGDLFTNPAELLSHLVPAGEHRGFPYFKNATHFFVLLRTRR